MNEMQVSKLIVKLLEKYPVFKLSYIEQKDIIQNDMMFFFKLNGKDYKLSPKKINNYIVNIPNEPTQLAMEKGEWYLALTN